MVGSKVNYFYAAIVAASPFSTVPASCAALLRWAGLEAAVAEDREVLREREIDRLADALEQSLELGAMFPQWFTP